MCWIISGDVNFFFSFPPFPEIYQPPLLSLDRPSGPCHWIGMPGLWWKTFVDCGFSMLYWEEPRPPLSFGKGDIIGDAFFLLWRRLF